MKRIALFADPRVTSLAFFAETKKSLAALGLDAIIYEAVRIEPTDQSFIEAARFASNGRKRANCSVSPRP